MRRRRRPRLEWKSDDELLVDGISYGLRPVTDPFPSKGGDRFCLRKPRSEVERLDALLAELEPERVLELGVYQGGSAALIAQLARPSKLVAVELESKPVRGLERFIGAQGLAASITVHWGTDAADRSKLASICKRDFEGEPLDLVIDDASHLLEPTRAGFDELFPRLRPGGVFLLEDWAWAHRPLDLWSEQPALSRLVLELVIAAAAAPGLIARVDIDRAWAIVTRGPDPATPGEFELAGLLGERGARMLDAAAAADLASAPADS